MNFFKKDELLTHTAQLFVALMVVNVCNVAYQVVVGRVLGSNDYALLMAFLAVLTIVSRPLMALNTAVNHYVSLMRQRGAEGDADRLLKKWMIRTGVLGVLLGVTVLIFSAPISAFFHIDRLAPVVVTGLILPAVFVLPVLKGAALGLQRFGFISGSLILGAMIRAAGGAFFVLVLYSACGWALLGHGASLYVTAGILVVALFCGMKDGSEKAEPLPSLRSYLLQSFLIQTAYAVLMNADIVLVKHYLPDNETFAFASTIGRMVAFLPAAIAMAMFPKVVSQGNVSSGHNALFYRSLVYTLGCVAVAVAGCVLLPRLPLLILFGVHEAGAEQVLLTRVMSVAMGASALLNVVVMFLLAQRRFLMALPVVLFAGLYLISVQLFHADSVQIAVLSVLFNTGGLIVCIGFLFLFRGNISSDVGCGGVV